MFLLAAAAVAMFGLSDRILQEQERVATVVTQTSRMSLQVQKVVAGMDRYVAVPTEPHRALLAREADELAVQHQRIVASTAREQDDQAAAATALDEIYFTANDPLQPKLSALSADASSLARLKPDAGAAS